MNKKTSKVKSILIKFSMGLYEQTWLITLTWLFMILSLLLLWNHKQCIKCANSMEWVTNFGVFNLVIFFLSVGILLLFTFFEISNIRRSLKKMLCPSKLLQNINLRNKDEKITIIPLYMIWIYALSRIIIFFVAYYNEEKSITKDIDINITWFFILFLVFYMWNYLRIYADKNYIFSIGYTVFVIIVTLLTLWWETLIPYILDISTIFQCVTDKYIQEHNLTTEHNISTCV